ncbi:MAG: diguanylate cyclase, partial [Vallitaleaceae bacterium]|nr:diguanylate cyclase [Vallitaleaceae bacterium]
MRYKLRQCSVLAVLFLVIITNTIIGLTDENSEELYDAKSMFENHNSVMLIIDAESGVVLDVNNAALQFYGYSREELLRMKISDINVLSPLEIATEMEAALKEERNYFEFEHKLKDGTIRNVEVYSSPASKINGNTVLYSIVHDITEAKLAELNARKTRILIYQLLLSIIVILTIAIFLINRLKKKESTSKNKYKSLFENMQEGFALHEVICNETGKVVDYRFLEANPAFERMIGAKFEDIEGKTVKEVFPTTEDYWIEAYSKVAMFGEAMTFSNYSSALNKYFKVNVYSPETKRFVTIFTDITDEKIVHEQIQYLSYHDQLTGLYNRYFFEEELKRLDVERNIPLTLAMIDVNGLKLTNDAFGHKAGDELLKNVAQALRNECRADDIISRIGGDEFVILLPKTSRKDMEEIVSRIYKNIESLPRESIVVSVSVGWDTKETLCESMQEVFSRAEDHMYRRKITESQSMRNQTIRGIMQTLKESSQMERLHSERVSRLSRQIAQALHMGEDSLKEIEVMGLMHDIGKIAVDHRILNKRGPLTEEEYEEIKKHPEIGYQILKSADVYTKLAEATLCHHEHWDGNGYPRGLKGEEIPFVARILAIADAFEAMTAERNYRQTLSYEEALEEIQRGAGTQFDPNIV